MRLILLSLVAVLASPVAAQQLHTSPVELVDASPNTPGLIISKAKLTPSLAKGTAVKPCGRAGELFGYVRLADACPAAAPIAAAAIAPAAPIAPKVIDSLHDLHRLNASSGSTGLVIRDEVARVRSFLVNQYPAGPAHGILLERVDAICRASCATFGRASDGITIRNVTFRRAAPATSASEIDAAIRLGGSKGGVATRNILIDQVIGSGFQTLVTKGYINGDGVTANRGVVGLTILNSRFDDNADAALDLKSIDTRLDNVAGARNKRTFRFWLDVVAGLLISEDPRWAHVWAGKTAKVTIRKLVAIGGGTLIDTEEGAVVEVLSCDLTRYTGGLLVKGKGRVALGAGCSPS